uniref:Uncharacterized protein n=1 Tax=Arundo donax TaxID=35708 RepID=A0A0A8XW69_ARUDO
MAKKSGVAQVK